MQVISVNTAKAERLATAHGEVLSAIRKRGRADSVEVATLGLVGDEQADPSVHGGLSKAVYAYPLEHYAFWQTVRTQARVAPADEVLPHGAMGENLTLQGLLENQVWIGDVLRFADCELAVSEPRQPCFKFNAAMGFNAAVKLMSQSGYCGFYLAVRQPGRLRAGEAFDLVPGPRDVGVAELFKAWMRR